MEIFSTLLAISEGNPPVDLRLNKRMSKQSGRR